MPNTFITLDVPSAEGPGTPAVVANTGHPKTFVLAGDVGGAPYVVEGSNDGGGTWDILIDEDGTQTLFTSNNAGTKSVDCIVEQVRVRRIGGLPTTPPPSITMGAPPAFGPSFFGRIPVPEVLGYGTPLDLRLRVGPLKTFTVRGRMVPGSRFTLLGSMDGVQFDEIIQYTADQQGARSREVMCRYLRVLRGGALGPAPAIAVGGEAVHEPFGDGAAAGSAEMTIASDRAYETTGTGEELFAEYHAPLGALDAASLVLDFAGIARATGTDGEVKVRVRSGGTKGAPDGDELASFTAGPDEAARSARSAVFVRPAAPTTLIKVTGDGQGGRAVLRGFGLLFHSAPGV